MYFEAQTTGGNIDMAALICILLIIILGSIFYVRKCRTIVNNKECLDTCFHWKKWAIIYGIILFLLNFARIYDNNFWGDEAFSIRLAKMSIADMLVATANDVHPPLYYLLLIVVYRLFGNYGWAYHLASLIPLVIMLIFSLTVIWKRFGRQTSFIFITLIGISNIAIQYNVEVRMYSLAFMFVLFSFYGFLKLLNGEKYGMPLFIMASLGAAYSHYYAMMSVAFFYLALFIYTLKKQFNINKLIACYACTVVGYMPWMLQMMRTFKRTSEGFWLTFFPGYLSGIQYYYDSPNKLYSYGMFIITILLVIFLIIRDTKIISIVKKDKYEVTLDYSCKATTKLTKWLLWGILAGFGTLVLGELISTYIRPSFLPRYLYPVASVVWLTLGVSVTQLKKKDFATILIVIVSLIVYVPNYFKIYREGKASDQAGTRICTTMQEQMEDTDIILTNVSDMNWTVLDYYFPDVTHKGISSGYDEFDSDSDYWIVWDSWLSDEDNI